MWAFCLEDIDVGVDDEEVVVELVSGNVEEGEALACFAMICCAL
jgi:hypothetical protein